MKKLAIALCLAITFAVPTIVLAAATNGPTWTTSKIEKYNGYDYELWNQDNKGNVNMKLTGDDGTGTGAIGGTFEATWSSTINVLFRSGRKFTNGNTSGNSGQTHKQIGNMSVNFAATWSSGDNVKMLGIYGWAFYASGSIPTKQENGTSSNFSNQIEYYIIQDRGSYNAATSGTNAKKYGSATIDGIAYDFWVCDRIGQAMLTGSGNFKQYFSVPQSTNSHRQSGTVSVSKHFEEWEKVGMKMDGPLYEVAMKVESYTGSSQNSNGNAKVTKNILTIGTATTSSNSTGGGTSSSSRASSSSAAKTQATTCPSANLVQYGSVPANPYTACFKYPGTKSEYLNKCYVCKIDNESDGNTCESSWLWNSVANVDDNLGKGFWYKEVTCPATSSSSVAVSSSSKPSSSSAAVSSSSKPSSSSTAASSSSKPSSSSTAASSSSKPSSSSTAVSSSSMAASSSSHTSSSSTVASSSSGVSSSSSSEVTEDSSSSGEDTDPILKNRIPVTHLSLQTQSDKTLRIEANAPTVVDIFDLRGNKVMSLNVSGSQTVKLSLPNGVYFAKAHGTKSIRFVLR